MIFCKKFFRIALNTTIEEQALAALEAENAEKNTNILLSRQLKALREEFFGYMQSLLIKSFGDLLTTFL